MRHARACVHPHPHTLTRMHIHTCAHPHVRKGERERTRAHTHARTRADEREYTGGWCAGALYTGRAHTYRSPLSIILPMWNSPPCPRVPRERPTHGVATPRIERDIDVTSQLSPSLPPPTPLRPLLPLFSSSATSPHSRRRETTPQDRKILALASPIIPDVL